MSLPSETPASAAPARERRNNPRLRELVDEMMATIRAAANVDLWSDHERAACEAEMARIMSTVRDQALDRTRGPGARVD